MLRTDIIECSERVLSVIEQSSLPDTISAIFEVLHGNPKEDKGTGTFDKLLGSLFTFDRLSIGFGENENTILHTFQIDIITDFSWRSRLLSAVSSDTKRENFSTIHELLLDVSTGVRNMRSFLPSFLSLLKSEHHLDPEFTHNNISKDEADIGNLRLIIPERDGFPSSSIRVSKAIEAVSGFLRSCVCSQK